jgi:flagellar FliJ protein
MKAFVYRFERKLSLVRQEEQAVRLELQVAMNERDRILEELDQLKNRIDCLEQSIRNHHGNSLIPEVGLRKEYLPILKEHFLILVDDQEAEKKVDSIRQQVVEKKRETKTFEKLRENDWQEYRYEMNREEQKIIDELSMASGPRNISHKGTGI